MVLVKIPTASAWSGVVSKAPSWLLALNASRSAPKRPASHIASAEEVRRTDF